MSLFVAFFSFSGVEDGLAVSIQTWERPFDAMLRDNVVVELLATAQNLAAEKTVCNSHYGYRPGSRQSSALGKAGSNASRNIKH